MHGLDAATSASNRLESEDGPYDSLGRPLAVGRSGEDPPTNTIKLESRDDIVRARIAARELAGAAGLGVVDQTRFVSAVSQLAGNALRHAWGGECELSDLSDAGRVCLQAQVRDRGPGINDIDLALQDGHFAHGSLDGGLPGTRRLVDLFELQSSPQGTTGTVQIRCLRRLQNAILPPGQGHPPTQLQRCAPRYQVVYARYLRATPGPAGEVTRELALLQASQLGTLVLEDAPSLDELIELHYKTQAALAVHFRAAGDSQAQRDAGRRLAQGQGLQLLHTFMLPHNLAQRAAQEQHWREQHGKLAALYDDTDALILGLDAEGRIESANPAYRRATGWSALQLATLGTATWHGPRPVLCTVHCKLEQQRRDGNCFTVQWSVTPIHGRAGEVCSYVCIGRDITREEQIECGLRENDKLRAVAVLAGGIAHDFNNLLGSILGLAELCEIEAPPGTRLARNSGRIGLAAGKAAVLVRQLLDFSRQTPAALEPIRISEFLDHASGLLQAALPPEVTLSATVAEDGTVRIDLVQMEQVLLNLTRNAAQAMGDSGGEIRIVVDRAEPKRGQLAAGAAAGARHARLRVADNGEGIPPEVLPRIFDPFFTTKPVGEGTGLGLAAVHGIIGGHDGVIEVASEAGAGTTFCLYLPLVEPG